jgi:hypothetical protein
MKPLPELYLIRIERPERSLRPQDLYPRIFKEERAEWLGPS